MAPPRPNAGFPAMENQMTETLRQKALDYMNATGFTAEANIANLVAKFTNQFTGQFGAELPDGCKEALVAMEKGLRDRKTQIENAILDVQAKYLTEEDLDALITWQNNPTSQKLNSLGMKIVLDMDNATVDIIRAVQAEIEPIWRKALGDPAEAQQAQELPPQQAQELPEPPPAA